MNSPIDSILFKIKTKTPMKKLLIQTLVQAILIFTVICGIAALAVSFYPSISKTF